MTVILVDPLTAAAVAVMVAVPGSPAVTIPVVPMVAMAAALLDQLAVPVRSCVLPSD
jgi:hypothetical protein